MITLSKFERLVMANIAQKPVELPDMGEDGELLGSWALSLSGMNKHEQYAHIQVLLSDLLVAEMDDQDRLQMMTVLTPTIERVIGRLRNDYIYEHQNLTDTQQQSTSEVRSLHFIMVLIYKNIASRAYVELHQSENGNSPLNDNWLKKLVKTVSGNNKDRVAVAIYHMTRLYVKLLLEYALTYQRAPRVIWQQLNFWYLRAIHEGVAYSDIQKTDKRLPEDSIHRQYEQACISSFINAFAYRRQDILNMFKIMPSWTKYVHSTFEPRPELKIFVNLLGNHPPELITPYATVNPYSDEYQCLFFDADPLIEYLLEVRAGKHITADAQSVFEVRLAKMVLLAFDRQSKQDRIDRIGQQGGQLLTGLSAVWHELSGGKELGEVINYQALSDARQPRSLQPPLAKPLPQDTVKITSKTESSVRFNYTKAFKISEDVRESVPDRSFLQVFGLFALRSDNSKNTNPWQLGIAHWVDRYHEDIEVDGRFLGRILMAAGVRLLTSNRRSQEFAYALLIDGDELNKQSTLIVPRYHFNVGDLVLLRIDTKEIQLRLERNLLSTDEIEQYQIVRLTN